jgi:phosphopantetheine--protein transferase-like protein
MNQNESLRGIVAKIGRTEADKIGSDFSLRGGEFEGSIRKAALTAAIRRHLGVDSRAAFTAGTYGELEQALFGQPSAAASTGIGSPAAAPITNFPRQNGTLGGLRCGVDLEMISEMPETPDYREHEFYVDSFSPEEIAYCIMQENPRMHFAARWCAKEALHKCDPSFRADKMSNIELVRSEGDGVFLRVRGKDANRALPHAVSVSHTASFAVAVVVLPAAVISQPQPQPPSPPPAKFSAPAASPPASSRGMVLAWLAATGLALWALLRTFR